MLSPKSASRAALTQAPGRGDRDRKRLREAAVLTLRLAWMAEENPEQSRDGHRLLCCHERLHTGTDEIRAERAGVEERELRPLDFAWPREHLKRLNAKFRRYGDEVVLQRAT